MLPIFAQPGRTRQTPPPRLETGFIDVLGHGGAVHDWVASPVGAGPGSGALEAPLSLLVAIARAQAAHGSRGGRVLWIGRRCWPYPPALVPPGGDADLLERSVFVDPPTRDERLWAIDVALRSPAARVVVADGRGLTMAHSRRLQLAAEAGGALGLIARPHRDLGEISAAATRWLVSAGPQDTTHRADATWTVELLRRKGLRPISEDARRWTVRVDDAARLVSVDADLPDRPAATARHGAGQAARSG